MNVTIPKSLEALVREKVKEGQYSTEDEVVADALRLMQARDEFAQLKRARLFVAGGSSNWIDRIARGSVVDFLNVGIGPLRTGIFNVADVAIMFGAGLFVLGEIRTSRTARPLERRA